VLVAGTLALLLGLLIAVPWHVMMFLRHGRAFVSALFDPPQASGASSGLISRLVELAPATLPFGVYGAVRALKHALAKGDEDDRDTVGGTLCLAWFALAALTPIVLSRGPRPALNLFLLVPLNLFSAATIVDLSARRIPARALCWIAPIATATTAWWTSTHLRQAAADIVRLQPPGSDSALGMHLAIDLVVVMLVAVVGLDRWARRNDDRRLLILGGCLGAALAVTITAGLREVRFRHRETSDLLALRDAILRRHAVKPFTTLAVVGPSPWADAAGAKPGGRLRFLLRATLPDLAQMDVATLDDLKGLPGGHQLVLLAGAKVRIDYSSQSRLGLEAIYPGRSGELEAFATRFESPRTSRR
jgi:hypothetical protein